MRQFIVYVLLLGGALLVVEAVSTIFENEAGERNTDQGYTPPDPPAD